MSEYTRLYKEDVRAPIWKNMIKELELPKDTNEISIKMISYMTERNKQQAIEFQKNQSAKSLKSSVK